MKNNEKFKCISMSLRLSKSDIYHILKGEYSKSQIDGWSRNPDSRKNATGNSNAKTLSRYREMSDNEFTDFCTHLSNCIKKDLQ